MTLVEFHLHDWTSSDLGETSVDHGAESPPALTQALVQRLSSTDRGCMAGTKSLIASVCNSSAISIYGKSMGETAWPPGLTMAPGQP